MTDTLSSVTITRLEKAAVDNGFDQELPPQGDWLGFSSTQCPLRVWLTSVRDTGFLIAVSQQNVARALDQYGTPINVPLPEGGLRGRSVTDIPSIHRLLRRAFQLSKTLPDELLHIVERQIAALPKTTEVERLVVQRVGQDVFRQGLIEYWDGRCAITQLALPELLRASHIKPWADCGTDAERLDVFNGFLLAPHVDAAFDLGFISVKDDGTVVVSSAMDAEARRLLGLDKALRVRALSEEHRRYLPWHRERIFRCPVGGLAAR
jgi:putative restriction endonuclease